MTSPTHSPTFHGDWDTPKAGGSIKRRSDAFHMTSPATKAMLERIAAREGNAPEFLQAVNEVAESLENLFEDEPHYRRAFEALVEPERMITFRVPWESDCGVIHVNRGFRVQFNSALGPFKGGLRFHPTVNVSVLKFLGFEQIFKNSLTTLPMGAGKGGSDFDPKGKSENEVRRFCVSFMIELSRHIGQFVDIPAGDIGVGAREIGLMYGAYKRAQNDCGGVFTGKNPKWGGSNIRPESTGYGTVYFAQNLLEYHKKSISGQVSIVSGSGNVSQYCIEKLIELGAKPVTVSDSAGSLYVANGISSEMLTEIMELKNTRRGRIAELDGKFGAKYFAGKSVWELGDVLPKADLAFPCATQNEIVGKSMVETMAKQGVFAVSEGANMPSDAGACESYKKHNIILCCGKAANAGGVATSGLEMSQNSMRLKWSRQEVDDQLKCIMKGIFEACQAYGAKYGDGPDDITTGANVAGFVKVADTMHELGQYN